MAKDIEINVQDAIRQLRREFANLRGSQFNLAIARAINHTIAKAKTAAGRDVRTIYKVKVSTVKKSLVLSKATRVNQTGYIKVYASPLPAIAFGARQNKRGVSINVMGKRKTIRSAFIAQGRRGGAGTSAGVAALGTSGHKGVFVRGAYKGTDLTYRTKRLRKKGPDLPIEEVMTTSVFGMMVNQEVQQATADKINRSFPARLLHELQRL